tara:strand:- start:69 stop:368 length:300 start_codon:yes stop_codon:yes gene_type:complete
MRKSELQEIIKELIRQELDEVSVTGNLDGGEGPPRTPYAFSSKKKKDKKKRKKISTISTGYELVSEEITDKDLRKISDIIRMEVALIFFDLFKKKALWT